MPDPASRALDFLVHRPDLTLYGGGPRLGLSLWNYPVSAYWLEVLLLVTAAIYCVRSAKFSPRGLRWLWGLVIALVGVQTYVLIAPHPASAAGTAVTELIVFLLVAASAVPAESGQRPVRGTP